MKQIGRGCLCNITSHFLPNLNKKKGMTSMIVRFSPRPEDLQRLQVGPSGPHLPSFATLVAQQGYCSVTGWLQVRLVAKLSRWLKQHRVPLSELNASRKERRLASVALRQFKAEDIAVKRNGAL